MAFRHYCHNLSLLFLPFFVCIPPTINHLFADEGRPIKTLSESTGSISSEEKDLSVIENEIERVNKIIKQLLDFARPRSPSLKLTDVPKVLEETLALVIYEMETQGVTLQRDYSPELPLVPMDREQMKQVFLNLILNALQAMDQGGRLTVTNGLHRSLLGNEGDSAARISFEDSGKGIPGELQNKIFDPFFSTQEEGIGLGLPIAQRIVEEHGGEILLESTPGKGTTFFLVLPFHKTNKGMSGRSPRREAAFS